MCIRDRKSGSPMQSLNLLYFGVVTRHASVGRPGKNEAEAVVFFLVQLIWSCGSSPLDFKARSPFFCLTLDCFSFDFITMPILC